MDDGGKVLVRGMLAVVDSTVRESQTTRFRWRTRTHACLLASMLSVAGFAQAPDPTFIIRLPETGTAVGSPSSSNRTVGANRSASSLPAGDDSSAADERVAKAVEQALRDVTYFQRTAHEYGPRGFVRRPLDTGPEYNPYLAHKSMPRAAHTTLKHANGNKTLIQWGGRIHLDSIYDFNPLGSVAEFVTATIPVPQEQGTNMNVSARQSRLEFKTQSSSRVGRITSFVQFDFFDSNTQGPSGSYRPRLRFAYADVGHVRFGQDASVFMDYGVYPNIIENEGPASFLLIRQPVLRVTRPLGGGWNLAVAAEQPYSDIRLPRDADGLPIGNRLQELPDFTGHLNFDNGTGHVQLAGLLRRISYQRPDESVVGTAGYGLNLTGDLHLWAWLCGDSLLKAGTPSPLAKCRIVGQYGAGYGIARYIQDSNDLGLDAAVEGDSIRALFARAWFFGYEHWWNCRWTSTVVFAEDDIGASSALASDTYAGASYLASNLIWNYAENAWVGVEYLWGSRRDMSGLSATANQLQIGMRYKF